MSLVNIYLKKTPLTSTENKFLIDDANTFNLKDRINKSLKRRFPQNLSFAEKFLRLSDNSFKKKKKRKKVHRYKHKVVIANEPSEAISNPIGFDYDPDLLSLREFIEEDHVLSADRFCITPMGFSRKSMKVMSSEELSSSDSREALGCCLESPTSHDYRSLSVREAVPAFGNSPALFGKAAAAFGKSPALFGNAAAAFGNSPAFFGNAVLESVIPEKHILEMPTYELDIVNIHEESEHEITTSQDADSSNMWENSVVNCKEKKMQFLNVVSLALMYSSNLKDKTDTYRKILLNSADAVRIIDPEFILKTALYSRQELQIRTVTNFLLSYAAYHQSTRIYLEKYFSASIVLPTDWIQVAEFYQVLNRDIQKKSFPSALRRAMQKSFTKFDKYQLAKYNRNRGKKKETSTVQVSLVEINSDDDENDLKKKSEEEVLRTLTLKQLIRHLHINSPTEHIMCLLGKKYPKSHEEFNACGLPGKWDPAKAGTRMKLPIPETWETQISANGNKPNVWESLIDNNKLPYMAMLRNLRNLILSGISSVHHAKVIKYLENKKSVINSRQLPMQFFEAFKVITSLESLAQDFLYKVIEDNKDEPFWKKAMLRKMEKRIENVSDLLLEQYKSAIYKAVEISSLKNLYPIPGKTLVICQINAKQANPGAKIKNFETCLMTGLMCLKACEDCKMNILSVLDAPEEIFLKEDEQFLDVLWKTCEKYKKILNQEWECPGHFARSLETMLEFYLRPRSVLSLKLDHIVFLQTSPGLENIMSSFLHKYRQIVNSDLLYTNVNFSLSNKSFSDDTSTDKDVYLCGSSSSLIKFIAERSSGGQLTYVENIDMKFNLETVDLKKYSDNIFSDLHEDTPMDLCDKDTIVPINNRVPKWHTVRIFISSTFKDMVSERDLLIRYVFPELRRRAASVFIKIVEIDLRWGITEADSATKKAAEICLTEAQKADLFVGLIGDRYGSIYNFDPPDTSDLQWVKDCSTKLSITELEIYAAALQNPQASLNKAFFYFRNNSFLSHVPGKWKSHFSSEDLDSKLKVDALKNKIRSNKFNIFDGYPCHWAGIFEDKPILGGLNVLGNRILDDLWKTVQEIHTSDPYLDYFSEEEMYQQNLIGSQNFFIETKNSPKESLKNWIKFEHEIFVVCGASGSGKTEFMINLLQSLKQQIVVKFFIGLSPRSRDLSYMLQYICRSICHQLGVLIPLPALANDIVNQFPDILMEAANVGGDRDFILLIDGLDHLENDGQKLDWLPLLLPSRMKIICSVSDTSQAFKVLCDRQNQESSIIIQELPTFLQSDRENFVREYLSYYRKTLEETAFNNNMMRIVTKKDSCNPFYLRIICDFLRFYATFDNLVSILQQLPSSTLLLFQEIILQMENEFSSTIIQSVLTLLCITKEGLDDDDLHTILSFILQINDIKTLPPFDELTEKISSFEPTDILCQVKYCSLIYVISTFAFGHLRQKYFSLVGTEFEIAVEKYYVNKNFISYSKTMHAILAAYYHNMCDVKRNQTFSGQSGFAFRCVLYHMLHGCLYKELIDVLCNHKFLEGVFRTKADDQLLEYYSIILYDILPVNQKISREIGSCSQLFLYHDFVSRNFHIFHKYPQLVLQQALNEPSFSELNVKNEFNCYLVENLSRSDVMDSRIATLCGFTKNITASAGEKMKPLVILGSEDGYLKVLDTSARKVVRTIKGHATAITCICFASKNRVCVSSADATLSLWDSENFIRIAVLSGHKHNVTSCCSDPSSSVLFSSGWDNTVRLWSLNDGRSISVIEDFNCPVNCIDHHPMKQEIVCGLWNGNIEIWDTISMQRKLAFSSSSGSVKSLAYTPDGINIISSFIHSEISVWSSEEGLKISSLKGHILPVKSLTYSFDEGLFISGSDDCTLKIWSAVQRSDFALITESKFCPIRLMEFMSENYLAVAFQNSEIWIIDINSGNIINKKTLSSDAVSVFSRYSPITLIRDEFESEETDFKHDWCEKSLVFGTETGKIMIIEVFSSEIVTKAEMNAKITAALHTVYGILCGTAEGDIGIFSHPDNEFTEIVYGAHKGFISSFCLSLNGELSALSTANDNVLKLWKMDGSNLNISLERIFYNKHKDAITYSIFNSECGESDISQNLLTGSHDNNIILWNENSPKVYHGLQSSVVNIACSGDYILGCGNDGAIVMWSRNGTVLTSIPGIDLSSSTLTFHAVADESDKFSVLLAFVDQDGSIRVRKPLQRTYCCSFNGHSKPITSCCTTKYGDVVSCSLDGSVSLWKVPQDVPDSHVLHSSVITGVILSSSLEFAVSSDAHGNLIAWKINFETPSASLTYAGKKSYTGGFIRALSWQKNNCLVCAVTQINGSVQTYFLDVIHLNYNSAMKTVICNFEMKHTYDCESEILCLDSCSSTDTIVVGLKSGDILVLTPETQKMIKMDSDWLLGVCLYTREKQSDFFCASFMDGSVKLFSIAEFMYPKHGKPHTFAVYDPTDEYKGSKFTSSMFCGGDGFICCGDSEGVLRIYSKHSLKFMEKIHDDSISGICIIESYIFTSSLDKTVKGWSLNSLKQVCQFYSHAPISCMSSLRVMEKSSNSNFDVLIIGTTSGNVHLLKFHCKKTPG